MTDSNNKNPEITLYFTIGIIGMDEPVTEYITIPLTEDDAAFQKSLAVQGQLAQLKLQTGFLEMMINRFPKWAEDKFGTGLPDDFRL